MRIPGPRRGLRGLETTRLVALITVCVVAAMTIENDLDVSGATPDFLVIAVVYAAVSSGAARGAAIGFGLGVFRDALFLDYFGIHALGFTVLGYGIGKLRETVYLQGPGVDAAIVAGAKIVLDVLLLTVASRGAWSAFETRFFWESPLAALFTAGIGTVLYRILRRS